MIEQEQQKQALAKLRDMVEEAIGRKMKTPKDFEFLSEQVFEKLHETVSATTLKRIWGYLSEASIPRIAFVKNLVDTNFVFTGVYRMSLELSDTTKLVWERVADEVDLNNLDYLETLRNDLSLASPGSPWITAQPK